MAAVRVKPLPAALQVSCYWPGKGKSTVIPDLVSSEFQDSSRQPKHACSNADKANVLNKFFASQTVLTGSDREVSPIDHVQRIDDAFSDLHTTPSAVYDIVSSLKVGKYPSHDDIPPCLLRACAKGISSSLASFFILSFTQGKVPAEWKKALVVPVLNVGISLCQQTTDPFHYSAL